MLIGRHAADSGGFEAFDPVARRVDDVRVVGGDNGRRDDEMVYEEAVVLSKPFDDVLDAVKAAFVAEGFGTLTEIDMQATLKEKLGKDMARYVIVGACNPHLASRALDVLPQIGVLLPCNVVVREADGAVVVEAMDPGLMASMTGSDDIAPIASEARRLVNNALARLHPSD